MDVAIVGGGQGGVALLKLFSDLKDINVVWVCDVDPEAPGIKLAEQKKIKTLTDFSNQITSDIDVVIDVTGVDKVKEKIQTELPENVCLMEPQAANLLIVTIEDREEMFETLQDQANQLSDMADTLNTTIQQIKSSMEEVTKGAEELSNLGHQLNEVARKAESDANQTNEVLEIIQKIANQTRIIGLNAAIEAARVGEEGKGFGVVATEVKKLADNSSDSIQQIESTISSIVEHIRSMSEEIENVSSVSDTQAASTEEVLSKVQEITEVVESLNDTAHKLSKES